MLEPILKMWAGHTQAGGVLGTVPGWGLWLTVIIAILVYGPRWNKQVADARAQKRAEQLSVDKEGRDDLRERVASLERMVSDQSSQLATLTKEAHSYELKLVSALSAFRLLAGELEKLDPTNPVLKQANDLIGMATTGDMGMKDVLQRLSVLPAVNSERKPDA